MNILWIGGWAIPINYIQAIVENSFPQHKHSYIYPNKNYLEFIEKESADTIIGYSLGATLLLLNQNHIFKNPKQYLIAPFLNIESATKVNETQLKFLLKNLKSNPLYAINDFYIRAQLKIPQATSLPYGFEDLYWGIETLIQTQEYQADTCKNPILLGQNDPLINPKFFQQNFSQLFILPGIDHNFEDYVKPQFGIRRR